MKSHPSLSRILVLLIGAVSFGCLPLHATLFQVDLSPLSGALNLGANPYTRDHAEGLSGLNSASQFTPTGSGNEFGAGILYDDVANLSLSISHTVPLSASLILLETIPWLTFMGRAWLTFPLPISAPAFKLTSGDSNRRPVASPDALLVPSRSQSHKSSS